jgi:hypothetical protein
LPLLFVGLRSIANAVIIESQGVCGNRPDAVG